MLPLRIANCKQCCQARKHVRWHTIKMSKDSPACCMVCLTPYAIYHVVLHPKDGRTRACQKIVSTARTLRCTRVPFRSSLPFTLQTSVSVHRLAFRNISAGRAATRPGKLHLNTHLLRSTDTMPVDTEKPATERKSGKHRAHTTSRKEAQERVSFATLRCCFVMQHPPRTPHNPKNFAICVICLQ